MKYLKGNGVPTRKTIGAIGDIYVDENTGIQYKCTFAYRSENDAAFDCQWTSLSMTLVEEKIEECLSAARRGETSASIERDDLTDDEVAYLQKEVQRRLGNS